IGLARTLDLRVVAEGVENSQQLAFLRRHGCDEAQGFGLARPLPPAQVTSLLAEGRRWRFLGAPPPRRRPVWRVAGSGRRRGEGGMGRPSSERTPRGGRLR